VERPGFLQAALNLGVSTFSQMFVFVIPIVGLYLLLSSSGMATSRKKAREVIGIILLGVGVGLLGNMLGGFQGSP
jgi:uncharacterized membrane protein YfcA